MLVARSCSRRFPLRLSYPGHRFTSTTPEPPAKSLEMGALERGAPGPLTPEIIQALRPGLLPPLLGWRNRTKHVPVVTFYHDARSSTSRSTLELFLQAFKNETKHIAPLRFQLNVYPSPPSLDRLRECLYLMGSGSFSDLLQRQLISKHFVPTAEALFELVKADPLVLRVPIVIHAAPKEKPQVFLGSDAKAVIDLLVKQRERFFGKDNLVSLRAQEFPKRPKRKKVAPESAEKNTKRERVEFPNTKRKRVEFPQPEHPAR